MPRPLRFAGLFIMVFALQGCGVFPPSYRATGTKTATAEHMAASSVDVQTRNGSVEIVADKSLSEVQITAKFNTAGDTQAQADQRLADASVSIARGTDRTLSIQPVFPGGPRNNDGASFTVRLPDAKNLVVNTSNGAVTITALSGVLKIDTSNGPITIADHDGGANIETSNGAIRVQRLNGSLDARSSNGPIEASQIAGKVKAHTSNGAINVVLAPDQSEPFDVKSSNGPIKATVGPAFAGTVKFDTSNGSIKIDDRAARVKSKQLTKKSGSVVIGDGGETSTIDTSNGTIQLIIANEK